jgi:hypothetical protein
MNCPVCGHSLSFLSSVLSGTATEKPPLEQLPEPPNLEITFWGSLVHRRKEVGQLLYPIGISSLIRVGGRNEGF